MNTPLPHPRRPSGQRGVDRASIVSALICGLAALASVTAAAQQSVGAVPAWSVFVGYGARTHLTHRAAGTPADRVSLGHTYGAVTYAMLSYRTRRGWTFGVRLEDGHSNRSSDEFVAFFDEAIDRYPGSFYPDFSLPQNEFQPAAADRYALQIGRDLALGTWTVTPTVSAGVLDVRLGETVRTFKQREANAVYEVRLRPGVRRATAPVIGFGADLGRELWRGLGLRFSAQVYGARPRYEYALVVRELVSGREDASASSAAGTFLVGQFAAGVAYRLPAPGRR